MSNRVEFISATPVLASLDIERSVDFFVSKLGFEKLYAVPGQYGIVRNGAVSIHFWACLDTRIPQETSCRVQVKEIERLFQQCQSFGIVQAKAPLEMKPWGNKELSILDLDGNLVTFSESAGS